MSEALRTPARLAVLAALAGGSSLGATEGPPPRLVNAQVETRPFADSLPDVLRNEGRGPAWIGYGVASLRRGHQCCFDSWEGKGHPRGGGCCRLEKGRSGAASCASSTVALEAGAGPHPRTLVMVRVEDGRASRLGAYSEDCGLDAGGRRVLWLTGVPDRESLGLLESLVAKGSSDLAEEALMAVAAHASPEADRVLERQTARGLPAKVREQAAFWMGEARGRTGYETLRRLIASEDDSSFREHVVFALSQSEVPEATDTLVETARRDKDTEVRGQALFWLAQKAGRRAKATITDAIENDPDTEVKKKAVFALSEMDDGVPLLIQVARTNRNPEVREQAFFWLGQSGDPKALDFLTEVLRR